MSSPDCSSSNHSQDGSSVTGGYFARYSELGSPFDIGLDEAQEEDILANIGVRMMCCLVKSMYSYSCCITASTFKMS